MVLSGNRNLNKTAPRSRVFYSDTVVPVVKGTCKSIPASKEFVENLY